MEAPDGLRDITQISVDTALPRRERIARFVAQAGSPYRFRVGTTPVNIVFTPDAPRLYDSLASVLYEEELKNVPEK